MFVYLDNSATTRVYKEAAEEAARVMTEEYGNPSSLHTKGFDAEKILTASRKTVADEFGASLDEICFTSGGTESDNTAIFGAYRARRRSGNGVITTAVEHPAVLEAMKRLESEGAKVTYVGVDDMCRVDPNEIAAAVDDNTVLISVMTVNNETGTIMPIRDIARSKKNALLHTDAVQAFCKTDIRGLGADLISVSGHKIHAPKGIGALYVKKGLNIPPYAVGGGQERGMRSGTENVPGIAGLAKAIEIWRRNDPAAETARMRECRDRLLANIRDSIADIRVNSPEDGCPSVLNVSFLGTRGEVILHTLEGDGIMVSTGSACSSGKKGGSHVLKAMGLSEAEITGAVRFSFGAFNTTEEMDYVADKVKAAVERFRRLGTFR